jgi:hypothetical protein
MSKLYTLSFVFFVILTGVAVLASGLSIVVQARLPKVGASTGMSNYVINRMFYVCRA